MSQVVMLTYDGHSRMEGSRLAIASARAPAAGRFAAEVRKPQALARGLLALGEIIRANYEDLNLEEWMERVLDPVVGIHPDGVSFEAFSQDGSTLGWVHFAPSVFGEPEVRQGGCTSIDYSPEFERYLSALTATSGVHLSIGTEEGVDLRGESASQSHHEKRISLPDGWLRGFAELHAGLAQAELSIPLSKADLFNLMQSIRRKVPAHVKGRGLIFELTPGEKARVRVQPWDTTIRLQAPPPEIDEPMQVKVFGRRRLMLLEKLVPHIQSGRVYLLGDSRPTHWEFSLDGTRFILALSSWMSRKFTGSVAESLRGPSAAVDDDTIRRAAALLADAELLATDELAEALEVSIETARAVGLRLCRRGLAVAEPQARGLRWRPLSLFPLDELAASDGDTSRETNAAGLIEEGKLVVERVENREGLVCADGVCEGRAGMYHLSLVLNPDGSFASATCECAWMRRQRDTLRGGPCKHLLALRAEAMARTQQPR